MGAAWGQAKALHPMDGMSATDIAIAARLKREPTPGYSMPSVDGISQVIDTSVDFFKFEIVEEKGRYLHEGYFPIPGEPLPGNVTALAELLGQWQTAQFRLVTEAGDLIGNITLSLPDGVTEGMSLLGNFDVPNQPFRVAVSGVGTNSVPYDITQTRLFRPQTVEVRFYPEINIVDPGEVHLSAEITNFGPLETFQLVVQDDMGVGVSISPAEVELAAEASSMLDITLQVPNISSGILKMSVTATATGVNNNAIQNFGVAKAILEKFELIIMDSFESGRSQ